MAIDLINVPDWGVLVGYVNESMYCRSYFDISKDYSIAKKFPWIIYTIEKIRIKSERTETIRNILKDAGYFFYVTMHEGHTNGLHAYETWISDLKNDLIFENLSKDKFGDYWQIHGWIYDSLYDARDAAWKFLERIEPLFTGEDKEVIHKMKNQFKEISLVIWKNRIHFHMPIWKRDNGTIWIPGDRFIQGTTWTKDMRNNAVTALEEINELEMQVFTLMKIFS